MTPKEFREQHNSPTTWTTADMETFEVLADIDRQAAANRCAALWDDATSIRANADRLRQLLAPAA